MDFLNRLVLAVRAGMSAFNDQGAIPVRELGWDFNPNRYGRYDVADRWSNNVPYSNIPLYSGAVTTHKINNKLAKDIQAPFNAIPRLGDVYVSKVCGGEIDLDNLTTGALRIANADDYLREAIKTMVLNSNWRSYKSLYVRYGVNYGNSFLKVVDDTELGQTRLEVLHPGKIKDMDKDGSGNLTRVIIEYERDEHPAKYLPNDSRHDDKNETYLYTEIITKDRFDFFKNGEPFPYFKDANGKPVSGWDNPYGFVPMVCTTHTDKGLKWGMNAYQHVIPKLDQINNQQSVLNNAVVKSVDIPWLFIGMQEPDDGASQFEGNAPDDLKVLYVTPRDGAVVDAKALVPNINIADAVLNISKLQEEIERDLPELSMHNMRMSSNQTAPGIKAQYNDAIDKLQEAQGNYNDPLSLAISMNNAIAGFRQYNGFEKYNLVDHIKRNFEFYIKPSPIIDDEITKSEKISFLMGSHAPNEAVWKELGVPEDDITEWVADAEQARADMMLAMDVTPVDVSKPADAPTGNMPPQLQAVNQAA